MKKFAIRLSWSTKKGKTENAKGRNIHERFSDAGGGTDPEAPA